MGKKFRWFLGLSILLMAGVALREPTEKYFDIARSLDIFATLFKEVNAYPNKFFGIDFVYVVGIYFFE